MKKFISGLILGLLIATASVVAANSEVVAKFTSFNFVINGESKQLDTQPVVVNGSSYLPVRELANLLGYDVTYKADSRTIELTGSTSSTDLSGTGETDDASYETTSSEPSKTNYKIVVGDRSTQSSGYVKNGVPLLHSGSIREIFSSLGMDYESSSLINGGLLIRLDEFYEFTLDKPSLVYISGESHELTTSVINEPVGLSGYAQYLPLDFFKEQSLINYQINNGTISIFPSDQKYQIKWMSWRDLAETYKFTVGANYMSNGELKINYSLDELKENNGKVITIESDQGNFRAIISNGRSYLNLDDLRTIGLIK
jgi:hypothetical protein